MNDPFLSYTYKKTEDLSVHGRKDTTESHMSFYSETFTSPRAVQSPEEANGTDPVEQMKDFLEEQVEEDAQGINGFGSDKYTLGVPYQSKIVQTVSEKVFGTDFNVDSSELPDGLIEITVRMPSRTDPQQQLRNISFQYDPMKDTAKQVAQEMATEFDLSTLDEAICAAAIDAEIHKFAAQSPRQLRIGGNGTPKNRSAEHPVSPMRNGKVSDLDPSMVGTTASRGSTQEELELLQFESPMMMEHFKELLESGEDSDVSIRTHGEDFHVHRVILSARSKVLKALLKEPKFKETGVLDLDIDPNILKMVLYYIYTGCLEGEHKTIMKYKQDLLKTAKDLEMPGFIQVLQGFDEEEDLR